MQHVSTFSCQCWERVSVALEAESFFFFLLLSFYAIKNLRNVLWFSNWLSKKYFKLLQGLNIIGPRKKKKQNIKKQVHWWDLLEVNGVPFHCSIIGGVLGCDTDGLSVILLSNVLVKKKYINKIKCLPGLFGAVCYRQWNRHKGGTLSYICFILLTLFGGRNVANRQFLCFPHTSHRWTVVMKVCKLNAAAQLRDMRIVFVSKCVQYSPKYTWLNLTEQSTRDGQRFINNTFLLMN